MLLNYTDDLLSFLPFFLPISILCSLMLSVFFLSLPLHLPLAVYLRYLEIVVPALRIFGPEVVFL